MFSNRQLAQAFNVSLPQVRRWAVVALGVDPAADKAKGVARTYNAGDAFKIYMTGVLINQHRMTLSEAKEHLNNLWPKLIEYDLIPTQIKELHRIEHYIEILIHPNYKYEFRIITSRNIVRKDETRVESVEKVNVIYFNPDLNKFEDHTICMISLSTHLIIFQNLMQSL